MLRNSGIVSKSSSRMIAVTLTVLGSAGIAVAQDAGSKDQPVVTDTDDNTLKGLEEIVVTAQKRSERISDVPLSITAAAGDELARRGITDTADLAKIVPGFTYQLSNYGVPVFTIRGVGFYDVGMGAGPAVTVYTDEVPLPYSIMTRGATLDLERVEALKGPQGILFGQNSTGGAINYVAAKPTSEPAFGAEISYGRFNEHHAEVFVSGALSDTVSARLSVRREGRDGWQKSITRPGDTAGERDFTNARLLVDWNPATSVRFALNLSGWVDKSDSQAAQFREFVPVPLNPGNANVYDVMTGIAPAPEDARAADWTAGLPLSKDSNFKHASLRGDFDITENVTLTSLTAYSELRAREPFDNDGVWFDSFNTIVNDGEIESFFQELRIAGEGETLKWLLGGNYQRDVANQYQVVQSQSSKQAVGPYIFLYSDYTANQQPTTKSAFGNLEFTPTDELTAYAGLRYTSQDRDFSGCMGDAGQGDFAAAVSFIASNIAGAPRQIAPGSCVTLNPATFESTLVQSTLSENDWSWRVGLSWKPQQDQLLYANVTRGYKSGGYSILPGLVPATFAPVTHESLLAYEIGFKSAFVELPLRLSGAVFYYDYSDKQLVGFGTVPVFGVVPQLVNIPDSEVYGGELELSGRPTDNLALSLAAVYVNSEVKKDPLPPAQTLTPHGSPTSYVGQAFPNTPEWQIIGDAEHAIPTGGSISYFVGGSVTYRTDATAAFGGLSQYDIESYAILDLRAGLQDAGGKWRVQIYGRNVTDEYYWINVGRPIDSVSRYAGMPATYGITASIRY